jgi:hypothetical protein
MATARKSPSIQAEPCSNAGLRNRLDELGEARVVGRSGPEPPLDRVVGERRDDGGDRTRECAGPATDSGPLGAISGRPNTRRQPQTGPPMPRPNPHHRAKPPSSRTRPESRNAPIIGRSLVRVQAGPLVIPLQGSWLGFAGSVRRDFGRRSLRGGSGSADDGHRDARSSSNSAVSAALTDTLASARKHSSRALPTSASHRTPTPHPYSERPVARNASPTPPAPRL